MKVRKKKTRLDVHYYMTYEELFERFHDKISLSEYIDYYCDLGVLVPETIFQQNRILRAFRTGEPNSDYNWQRTQILIPIAIEQLRRSLKPKGGSVDPMVLNKLLSNFVYDYPSDQHHELHCLIGEPYTFGTLVRTYHHHRAYSRPSIYKAEKISPYYRFDGKHKKFTAINTPEIAQKIKYLFDERQEIPFSEIITYFKLLSSICAFYKRVDVLNMLSICREENYFYSHILYNIKRSYEEYGNYLDRRDKKDSKLFMSPGSKLVPPTIKLNLLELLGPLWRQLNPSLEMKLSL